MRERSGAGSRASRGEQLKRLSPLVLPAVWVLGTLVSTGVAYAAVQMVSGSVVESQREPLTSTSAGAAPSSAVTTPEVSPSAPSTPRISPSPAAPPPPTGTPTRPPSSSPPQPASNTRTFTLIGGTTQLTCNGNAVSLDWATPASGFWVETSTENGGGTVEVRFRSDTHESRLDAWCAGGVIQFSEREESS